MRINKVSNNFRKNSFKGMIENIHEIMKRSPGGIKKTTNYVDRRNGIVGSLSQVINGDRFTMRHITRDGVGTYSETVILYKDGNSGQDVLITSKNYQLDDEN